MYKGLVGVHHLLHVDGLIHIMGETGILVECLISLNDFLYWTISLDDLGGEDTTGEVASVWDEVDVGIQMALHLTQALLYLGHMLVVERLVYAHITHTPREMSGGSGFLTCTGTSCNGIYGNVFRYESHVCGGK